MYLRKGVFKVFVKHCMCVYVICVFSYVAAQVCECVCMSVWRLKTDLEFPFIVFDLIL